MASRKFVFALAVISTFAAILTIGQYFDLLQIFSIYDSVAPKFLSEWTAQGSITTDTPLSVNCPLTADGKDVDRCSIRGISSAATYGQSDILAGTSKEVYSGTSGGLLNWVIIGQFRPYQLAYEGNGICEHETFGEKFTRPSGVVYNEPALGQDCASSDWDNDGLTNSFDNCPEQTGNLSSQGCPTVSFPPQPVPQPIPSPPTSGTIIPQIIPDALIIYLVMGLAGFLIILIYIKRKKR